MTEVNRNIPKRRFKEFQNAGDWEQRKLGELATSFGYGLNSAATEYDGENKYLRITDIDDESREFKLNDLTSPEVDLSGLDEYRLSIGDLLFARTGASVGKSYIYKSSDEKVYFAGFLIRVKIKDSYNPEFIFYNTFTVNYERFINITSMRSGQPGVNAQEYSNYEIRIPILPEQKKIGTFFSTIDRLITLHQRKLDKLKNVKKAYLSELFPAEGEREPKRRFSGFTEPWEQRKLGEEVNFYNGRAFKQSELLDSGKYKVVRVGNFNTNEKWYYSNLELEVNQTIDKGDLLYLWATSFGPEIWKAEKSIYHYHIWKLIIKQVKKIDKNYLHTWLFQDKEKISQNTNGSTMVHVTKGMIEEREFDFPSLPEQKKIGTFFSNLDRQIALHQRKLDKLKDMKKAYLNELFV